MARSPFMLPTMRATPARALTLPAGASLVLSLTLVLGGLIGGGLLSAKWQTRSGVVEQQSVTRQGSKQFVDATIQKLESDQVTLKHDLADARARLDSLQAGNAQEKAQLADVTNAVAAARADAGLLPLEGPGVVAIFQDSTTITIPQNEDPANYILHDYMLRDVLNTLWAAGAEAVSLNGERVTANTALYCVGTTIICNATRLSPPYEVHAIGNPNALESGLRTSSQMQQFNQRAQIYDLPITIRQDPKVQVPAFSGAVTYKYAHPGDVTQPPTATAPAKAP